MPVSLNRILALVLAATGVGLALWLVLPLRAEPGRAAAVLALLALGVSISLAAAGTSRFVARTWVRCVAVAAGGLTCALVCALRFFVALDTLPSVPLSDTTLRSELTAWCDALDAVAVASAYLTAAFLVVPAPRTARPGIAPDDPACLVGDAARSAVGNAATQPGPRCATAAHGTTPPSTDFHQPPSE